MSTAWVAGTVRAKALARRRLGAAGARVLADSPSLSDALAALVATPYGHDVRVGDSLAEAQHAVGATLLWHLRVLSGWLPRGGADAMRLLAGGFEIANVEDHVSALLGRPTEPSFRLGMLDTAWSPRLVETNALADVQEVLAASPWGDPGAPTPWNIHVGMRLAWADRVASGVPEAAPWARAAAALLVVREVLVGQRTLPEALALKASYVLGPAFVEEASRPAPSWARLSPLLSSDAQWVLLGLDGPADLWRAEVGWWHRVEQDGFSHLRGASYDRAPVVGAVAVLAVDAWRVRAALEAAARRPTAGHAVMEAFDAVA